MTPPAILNKPLVGEELPPLEPGDHMDQKTFHARYEAMPRHVRAELVEGVVYMPSPLKIRHGGIHPELGTWLTLYKAATPGTATLDNTTTILGESSEPQPDSSLRILPEYGGQTRENEAGYLVGGPEFIGEVAASSESYDLHAKRRDYEAAGVQEYLVAIARQQRIVWFVRREGRFAPLEPGADGIYRSQFFGGLWLDPQALFRGDTLRIQEVLQQGLASPEHARLVKQLKQHHDCRQK